jgi:starvation-inducible DNA-binding protein
MTFTSPTPAPETVRAQAAEKLQALVANGVVLYLAAQDAHWNVKGPSFGPLHELFGELYATTHGLVDRLAERAVTLGGTASGLSVLASKSAVALPAAQDGLGLCAALAPLLAAYIEQLNEALQAMEGVRLAADANALQDAIESLEKLGWKIGKHLA